jgi:hypothetical protein
MFKSKINGRTRYLGEETKTAIREKIEGFENLTEEEFDGVMIMMKSLRLTLLEQSKILYKCSSCGNVYYSKHKFCSNCGIEHA